MIWPRLEQAADEARALLALRQANVQDVDRIAALSDFLMQSELTETKAFIRSFVKQIAVRPGKSHHPLHHPHA